MIPDTVYDIIVQSPTDIDPSILYESEEYTEEVARYNTFSTTSYIFMIISIILGSLLMYVISGVVLKPVELLSQKISKIDRNELSFRITDFSAGDELNKLADSFNMMLTRLEDMFNRESRFSSDAAHELKTPLTVIKTNLDILYLDENPTKEECLEGLAVVKR